MTINYIVLRKHILKDSINYGDSIFILGVFKDRDSARDLYLKIINRTKPIMEDYPIGGTLYEECSEYKNFCYKDIFGQLRPIVYRYELHKCNNEDFSNIKLVDKYERPHFQGNAEDLFKEE